MNETPVRLARMRNLTVTLCLTLAVLLGSSACAPNSGKGPVITSDAVSEKPKSGLEASFTKPEVTLRSEPNLRSPAKVVKQAIGKKAILLKQIKSWIQIQFEGENFWVQSRSLDKNLKPAVGRVLFKVSDVNLRSGPGTKFPVVRVLKDAKYRIAVPFESSGNWVHIVFDKHPYWIHSALIQQYKSRSIFPKSADQDANQWTYFDDVKIRGAAGDPKAMEFVGMIYEGQEKLHLEMSYMWFSLAMENASLTDKKRIQKHLEEFIIPKLQDSEIANAQKRIKRCKKFKDCGETKRSVFQQK